MSTRDQNGRHGTNQMAFDQSMRQRMRHPPLAIASHPTHRGRTRVAAMSRPQQRAKLPSATRALANAACDSSNAYRGDLRVEIIGGEHDSDLIARQDSTANKTPETIDIDDRHGATHAPSGEV